MHRFDGRPLTGKEATREAMDNGSSPAHSTYPHVPLACHVRLASSFQYSKMQAQIEDLAQKVVQAYKQYGST